MGEILLRLRQQPSDEEAWTVLYERLWPFVYGIVYYRLHGARTAAEDAAQEVFLRLARAWPALTIVEEAAWRAYVWRVADNVAKSWRIKLRPSTDAHEGALEDVRSPVPTPEAEAIAGAVFQRLISTLDGVDLVVARRLLEGDDLPAISRATGLSYNAAAVRVHRLRLRIRKHLKSEDTQPIDHGAKPPATGAS